MQNSCSNQTPGEKKLTVSPVMAAILLMVFAYSGSHLVAAEQADQRYPLQVEYTLMQQCMTGQIAALSGGDFEGNRSDCVCAVQRSMNQINLNRFKINKPGFYHQFEDNLRMCQR